MRNISNLRVQAAQKSQHGEKKKDKITDRDGNSA